LVPCRWVKGKATNQWVPIGGKKKDRETAEMAEYDPMCNPQQKLLANSGFENHVVQTPEKEGGKR